jgi:hypothetical protein
MTRPPLELLVRTRASPQGFALHQLDSGAVLLRFRPRPPAGLTVEVRRDGPDHWILHVPRSGAYLRVDEVEHALWLLMDGSRTMQDVALAYFVRFGSLDLQRVSRFLAGARRAGLIEEASSTFLRVPVPDVVRWERRWESVGPAFARLQAAIAPFFAPWTVPAWASVAVAGVCAHVLLPRAHEGLGWGAYGSALLGAWALGTLMHEAAHGLACAAFGRTVRAVGVSWRGAFVDTTDMFLAGRRAHALVALAGPAASLMCAGLCGILSRAPVLGDGANGWALAACADALLLQALVTAWPFLPNSDGAHALADLTGVQASVREVRDAAREGRLQAGHVLWAVGVASTAGLVAALVWQVLAA